MTDAWPRVLEPEWMDSDEEATTYDGMDHAVVNQRFVDDFLSQSSGQSSNPIPWLVDLGTGTGQIPIRLAATISTKILAVDAAAAMLRVALEQITSRQFTRQIQLILANARSLPFDDGEVHLLISNSLIHHIHEPEVVIAEIHRVLSPGGRVFVRDLSRPASAAEAHRLVQEVARQESPLAQKLFAESLQAALTVDEMRALIQPWGYPAESVQVTSNRHWTWSARKPG